MEESFRGVEISIFKKRQQMNCWICSNVIRGQFSSFHTNCGLDIGFRWDLARHSHRWYSIFTFIIKINCILCCADQIFPPPTSSIDIRFHLSFLAVCLCWVCVVVDECIRGSWFRNRFAGCCSHTLNATYLNLTYDNRKMWLLRFYNYATFTSFASHKVCEDARQNQMYILWESERELKSEEYNIIQFYCRWSIEFALVTRVTVTFAKSVGLLHSLSLS